MTLAEQIHHVLAPWMTMVFASHTSALRRLEDQAVSASSVVSSRGMMLALGHSPPWKARLLHGVVAANAQGSDDPSSLAFSERLFRQATWDH